MKQEVLFQKYLTELESQLSILTDKSEENALNTLYALWHTVAGNRVSPIKAIKLDLPILEPNQVSDLEELIKYRLQGVPLAHLTERQNFMGLDYIVNKGLYIPRKETELLAETAIKLVLKDYSTQSKVSVIDLCTGIGTVALTPASTVEEPEAVPAWGHWAARPTERRPVWLAVSGQSANVCPAEST